jgi:hypothetical protein
MKPDTRPVDLHKVKYEKKRLIIEGIVTIRKERHGRNHNAPKLYSKDKNGRNFSVQLLLR